MSNISFHKEEVNFDISAQASIIEWLEEIARHHNSEIKSLTYIFCGDEYLLKINKEYLDHDYFTDIITFPYQQGEVIESDIFISVDRVAENAAGYGIGFETELLRVIAHGLLHLIGFGDKTEKEKIEMRFQEDYMLKIWETSYQK